MLLPETGATTPAELLAMRSGPPATLAVLAGCHSLHADASGELLGDPVEPTRATHAILTQLKAGECIRHSI